MRDITHGIASDIIRMAFSAELNEDDVEDDDGDDDDDPKGNGADALVCDASRLHSPTLCR